MLFEACGDCFGNVSSSPHVLYIFRFSGSEPTGIRKYSLPLQPDGARVEALRTTPAPHHPKKGVKVPEVHIQDFPSGVGVQDGQTTVLSCFGFP